MRILKKVTFPFFTGASILTFFSFFQKVLINANPFVVKGYIVPVLFGGAAGIIIGTLKQRWETEAARVKTAKLQAIIEMAGAVCHEMNQPLQAISGDIELLLMDLPEDDPKCKSLYDIRNQAQRMGEITNKVMRVTKYETKDYVFPGTKIIDLDRASAGPK